MTPPPMLSRQAFLAGLQTAVVRHTGYAAAKVGPSEVNRLLYSVMAARPDINPKVLKVLAPQLIYAGLNQAALFPPDPQFYLRYNEFYVEHMRQLDCLGVFPDAFPAAGTVLDFYNLTMPLMDYVQQEPDRSSPSQEANCYLPYFQGKRILIICSFANLLAERARQDIFEGVWAKTGKRWFYPASVDALEFPYGYSASTHARYPSSLEVYDEITAAMRQREFDVALIAAAGLGIPIAGYAKQMGKVAIHLGGHLQVLFGVIGQRWRDRQEWRDRYFNEWWIDMPAHYRPPERNIADNGAYW